MKKTSPPPDKTAIRKRLIYVAALLFICGTSFTMALLYGLENTDTAFQVRWVEHGRRASSGPISGLVEILIATGLATVLLLIDLVQSWRDYKIALRTKSESPPR